MSVYNFYYDESEHSRIIGLKTVSAENYFDDFVTVIVGWTRNQESMIGRRYLAFEEKYSYRKSNGELKSTTLKPNQFRYGFASLSRDNVQFLNDYLSLFNTKIHFFFSVFSKLEYILWQILIPYSQNRAINIESMVYSITKILIVYRPMEIIECLYNDPASFVSEFRTFLKDRIECNKQVPSLKAREINSFQEILQIFETISAPIDLQWNYRIAFEGFQKYLKESRIKNYSLTIDKEGSPDEISKTLRAAEAMNLRASESDSINCFGIRMADIMAGTITKLMKALSTSLKYHSLEEGVQKKLLPQEWFAVSSDQLGLYKRMYKIICKWDHAWYKTYAGTFFDDLVILIEFINYMAQFKTPEQIQVSLSKHPDQFNRRVCSRAMGYFRDYFSAEY